MGGTDENCKIVIHDGGVYGEETLGCDLSEHEGDEHHDPRIGWWDSCTKARVMSAARRTALERGRQG